MYSSLFFFNDTATTEIYTLSLHDALPISLRPALLRDGAGPRPARHRVLRRAAALHRRTAGVVHARLPGDRKSTRLNSSHQIISYAVFCLKKKTRRQNMDDVPLTIS